MGSETASRKRSCRELQKIPETVSNQRSSKDNHGPSRSLVCNEQRTRTTAAATDSRVQGQFSRRTRMERPAASSPTTSTGKVQSQFIIGIEEEPRFRVCRKLLGTAGEHMKRIAGETGARLRLRGQGSKFLEGPEQRESTDPLMLCVSAPDQKSYDLARSLVEELLVDVYRQYSDFCKRMGLVDPQPEVRIHIGARAACTAAAW